MKYRYWVICSPSISLKCSMAREERGSQPMILGGDAGYQFPHEVSYVRVAGCDEITSLWFMSNVHMSKKS